MLRNAVNIDHLSIISCTLKQRYEVCCQLALGEEGCFRFLCHLAPETE